METSRITADELPSELSPEIIAILVNMARENQGRTMAWMEVARKLRLRGQLDLILEQANPLTRLNVEDFPIDVLPPDIIDSLVLLSLEKPNSVAFITIFKDKLTQAQKKEVYDRHFNILLGR